MDATVERPGKGAVGPVPIGLSLWVGQRPILEERVIFLDRPDPRRVPAWPDGRVSLNGRSWWLIGHGLEEEFEWAGHTWLRHQAQLWDEDRDCVVGTYYWCVQAGPAAAG
jgi:hypothetical protein